MKNILVIRNDKIGDFMLSWPAFALLKASCPDARVVALVPPYTKDLALACPWIDDIIIDIRKDAFLSDIRNLSHNIRACDFDASISIYSELRTSAALALSGIRSRYGPATKIAQIFLNNRLRQKRSRSLKPEYEYNLDLIRYYISSENGAIAETPPPPYLSFDANLISGLKQSIYADRAIDPASRLVIIHPGTGGSAINLGTADYAALARTLADAANCYFMITCGPGEEMIAEELSGLMSTIPHHIHHSTTGIIDFCKLIDTCDLFISGSTGPLHIAGALNVNTAAFYPARRSATALRWQTLNEAHRRLAISATEHRDDRDMQRIDLGEAADQIVRQFFSSQQTPA